MLVDERIEKISLELNEKRQFTYKAKEFYAKFSSKTTSKLGLFFVILLFLLILLSFLDEFLYNYFNIPIFPVRYYESAVDGIQAPSFQFLLGTDLLGRDLLVRLIYAARLSISIAVLSAMLSIVIGAFFGLIAGYFQGIIDSVIDISTDILLSIPSFLLALSLIKLSELSNYFIFHLFMNSIINKAYLLVVIVGITTAPYFVKIIRIETIKQKKMTYVKSAKVIGQSPKGIIFTQILPNVLDLVIIYGTLNVSSNLLIVVGLSFLGLGIEKTVPEWGNMINLQDVSFISYPHVIVFPGLAILLSGIAFNFIGEGLRDAIDPNIRTDIIFAKTYNIGESL